MSGPKLIYEGCYSINPQFFKLYQGNGENKPWWDLGHCVICSGGIVCFLAVPEGEISPFLSVDSCIPDICQRLNFCSASHLTLGKQRKLRLFTVWPVVREEMLNSVWVCVRGARGMDDDWLWPEHIWSGCQGSGDRILMLDVSSSPYGRLASIRHNLALLQSSDFVGVLFNPCSRSLMNLFNMTSPQFNIVPFIIIICLQSCS